MRLYIVIFVLLAQVAWPQVQSGTAIAVIPLQDGISVAADSRASSDDGSYTDTQCKIAAFGHNFLLVIAGFADDDAWNGNKVAREIWSSVNESNSAQLVDIVLGQFVSRMKIFINAHPYIIEELQRRHPEDHIVASIFAAATDASGKLASGDIDLTFDRVLTTKNGFILNDKNRPLESGRAFLMGHSAVMQEFVDETTPRAKKYMQWFDKESLHLPDSEQWPMFASKLVELAILFDPDNDTLGFPIDVVQLTPTKGVNWIRNEKHCPEE